MTTPDSSATQRAPILELESLDELWFQGAGTLCNLSCHHCFISCHPGNDSFGFLSLAEVERRLEESAKYGVKEYYFTGGEPFLHPDIFPIILRTLSHGPLTILTNGILIDDEAAATLGEISRSTRYSLDLRVSLDGTTHELCHLSPVVRHSRGVVVHVRARMV